MATNILGDAYCEYLIDVNQPCPHRAKIEVKRPNPVDPQEWPKHFCYAHLSAFIRRNTGQFIVEMRNE